MGVEIFYVFKKVLFVKGFNMVVGDEGGFVFNFSFNVEVLVVIVEVVENVGYKMNEDIIFVLDCVVFEFYKDGKYVLFGEDKSFDLEVFGDYFVDFFL